MGLNVLYYLRCTLALVILSIAAIYGIIVSILCTIIGKQHLSQYLTARFYYTLMKYGMGIDVKIIGEENLSKLPYVLISNHQSELDVLMIGKTFPPGCTVTAKGALKRAPILGWFMSLSGTVFLDRTDRTKSVTTLNNSLTNIKKNKRAVCIFPEGTRSYSTELHMLPFKKGAFHLAQQGELPIVPVVVANTSSLLSHKWKTFNSGCMIVKVLKPIPTKGLKKEDITAFSEKVRSIMEKELKELGYCPANNITSLPPVVLELQKKNL
ncbi:lysophospholipid acyltransferase family protein NDAI_0F00220 [Naumovozyma dairenensis CBS 421]|uniref:1-acyl-sn-glycerol-3-phosphate acyltransferase n=1 Tax=Naumovozyma dairenensis (strain ATCC 10597 / BCRC 20456 / CBS 421 / NBRC 0211 / NRRL Y-12639) TaxID=1071378 RepID=G0WC30_NAUDC|nr:hypothetical protein NDAI_0F00220 [Naumovozyma dairenensis CBS 421]CCD25341.1 hypothetical protein NDAI_0F00220 [Naumovozyma dairenensis CBS 421]